MSWLARAIEHRRYFAGTEAYAEGTKLVHRWIQLIVGPSVQWAAQILCDVDACMAAERHDGASGWGMFRNDLTSWLAIVVRERAMPADRPSLVDVAACSERYLGAISPVHARTTAPICAAWKAVLDADTEGFDAFVDRARAVTELRTLGAGGVLPLIEASRRVVDRLTPPVLQSAMAALPARSGEVIGAPIVLRAWARDGSEVVRPYGSVEQIRIGRAPDADIRFDDPYVARAHCVIEPDGAGLAVRDQRSDNRTFLFATAIDREVLQVGDVLVVGAGNLVFVEKPT